METSKVIHHHKYHTSPQHILLIIVIGILIVTRLIK